MRPPRLRQNPFGSKQRHPVTAGGGRETSRNRILMRAKQIAVQFVVSPSEFIPKCPDDLLGPPAKLAVAVMAHAMRIKAENRCHLKVCLCGQPGTGKTTIANMIADALSVQPMEVERVNGRNVTIETVREWQKNACYGSMFGGWTVKVINELDLVPMAAQELMLSYLDELRPRFAIIGTSNESTDTLSERFLSRFQIIKVASPDQPLIRAWLVKKWKVSETAAQWISMSCCGNVREALLQSASYINFGVLPEKKDYQRAKGKDSSRVGIAQKYWQEVRSGLRPAPGMNAVKLA